MLLFRYIHAYIFLPQVSQLCGIFFVQLLYNRKHLTPNNFHNVEHKKPCCEKKIITRPLLSVNEENINFCKCDDI